MRYTLAFGRAPGVSDAVATPEGVAAAPTGANGITPAATAALGGSDSISLADRVTVTGPAMYRSSVAGTLAYCIAMTAMNTDGAPIAVATPNSGSPALAAAKGSPSTRTFAKGIAFTPTEPQGVGLPTTNQNEVCRLIRIETDSSPDAPVRCFHSQAGDAGRQFHLPVASRDLHTDGLHYLVLLSDCRERGRLRFPGTPSLKRSSFSSNLNRYSRYHCPVTRKSDESDTRPGIDRRQNA